MRLNNEQARAVQHRLGPAMVLAGPGSGKTMVITHRIRYLIESGVSPEHILVITFTRAAAQQMRERFTSLSFPEHYKVTFGTFHAVFFQILKHSYGYNAENILREEERFRILYEIADRLNIDCGDLQGWAEDVLSEISKVKENRIPLAHYYSASCPEETFRKIAEMYLEKQRVMNKIDFDDMCLFTLDLFHARKDLLTLWQNRFRFILVDEFQDINPLQYRIVKQLAAPENNLFIVGDDDQSIYGFRGSMPQIMLQFPTDYPGAEVMMLRENYRSQAAIVNASLHVISENRKRYPKELFSRKQTDTPIEVICCSDVKTEHLYVLKKIRESQQEGIPLSEIAILTRTNREERGCAALLAEFQIPYEMKDNVPLLWDHWIAKDLTAYLRLQPDRMRREDLLRVCNRPNRYITRQSVSDSVITMEGLRRYYREKEWMGTYLDELSYTVRMLSGMQPYAAIQFVRSAAGYDRYLKEYAQKRKLDESELVMIADEIQESARGCRTAAEWMDHIHEIRERMVKERKEQHQKNTDKVMLATLHGAKGLEFTEVFLLNVNEGIMPYHKAVLEEEIEEERRLFYVGMTRAARKLHILYLKAQYRKKMEPSRFLKKIEKTFKNSVDKENSRW